MTELEQLNYVKNIARKFAKSPQDADDIASISIIKALTGNLKEKKALKSWLYVITKRSVYNFYRNNLVTIPLDKVPPGEYTIREFKMDFEKTIKHLSPRRKQCIRLYCHGFRWVDISKELNISSQNARTSTMDAIKELKSLELR